eukprot:TRINITY_DN13721_c0_g1_i1.p1 TRINITY_DN13721_c0_g1~~TRINITY_DN13721_c0_g1_i1.p1  ORF type:complete len:155 (+),score=32.73 TRINITY_DN13721_c0_g1_i1:119-583(+)
MAKLLKQAVEGALNQLKENQPVLLSSKRQSKIRMCVPDLSRCLANLVKFSTNSAFQQECLATLGLEEEEGGFDQIEDELHLRLNAIVEQLDEGSGPVPLAVAESERELIEQISEDYYEGGEMEDGEYEGMEEDRDFVDAVVAGGSQGTNIWDYL